MNITSIFYGKVKNGKLKLDNPQGYLVTLSRLEGQDIELTIKKQRQVRSLQQNAYYWSVVVAILADYFGYEPDELHDELKLKFNPKHSKIDYDKTYGGTTTKMSTQEFSDYIDRVIRWASLEYNIVIPTAESIDI